MKARTSFWGLSLALVCLIFIAGCSLGVPMSKGQQWLDTKTENSGINVAGKWYSPEWGSASFKQADRNVSGNLGDYQAKGVVSGKSLYLMMYSGDKVHYSADLKLQSDGSFAGYYTKYELITDEIIKDYDPSTNRKGDKAASAYLRPMNLSKPD